MILRAGCASCGWMRSSKAIGIVVCWTEQYFNPILWQKARKNGSISTAAPAKNARVCGGNELGLAGPLAVMHNPRVSLALKHPVLTALSFNKPETRERLRLLMGQGDYKREAPLTFIQSSDAHGTRGRIGQPRTDVLVRNGRPTFSNIREAFRQASRVKCSVDVVEEEYKRLTADEPIFRYKATGQFSFSSENHQEVAITVCGILNSRTGIIELEGSLATDEPGFRERVQTEIETLLNSRLLPTPNLILSREFRFSASKVKLLFKPVPLPRLSTCSGTVYVIDCDSARHATPTEIESVVAAIMEMRFGSRFKRALEDISSESMLLSKMPAAMPLLLRCRDKFEFVDSDDLKLGKIGSLMSGEKDEEFADFYNELIRKNPFGNTNGSMVVISDFPSHPREREHYMRFLPYRCECGSKESERFGSVELKAPSILVRPGGCSHYCESGTIISESPIFSISTDDSASVLLGLAAWFKSSFFIWYSAVYLGDCDLYQHLQDGKFRFPIPERNETQLYTRLSTLANNILLEERRFLQELNREMQRGADSQYREKLRTRHNSSANGISLLIDDEIYNFLQLDEKEREFISQTLLDLKMSDFGFLERSNKTSAAGA